MSKSPAFCVVSALLASFSMAFAHAGTLTFASPVEQAKLIELYTSEGCSSCPPADQWLSRFKSNSGLWKKIVPVAFHVDYWDYLGWKDPFSNSRFSQRQRHHALQRHISTVYTPGVIKNGKEWRSWHGGSGLDSNSKVVGILTVSIDNKKIHSQFEPKKADHKQLQLNIALLGFDLITHVQSGENEGKKLAHDFVSLSYDTLITNNINGMYEWDLNKPISSLPNASGIAVWVSTLDDLSPIQATGAWLK